MPEQVDVVVVGLGVGGEEVAGRLAEAGLSVVGIENRLVGGECPYWGCVPSKMMVRAANLLAEGRRVSGMAGSVTVKPDWAPVVRRIRDEATDDWNDQAAVKRFTEKGGRFVRGYGQLVGPGQVRVADGQEFRARRGVVLGVGTSPSIPPLHGLAETPYWTNRQAIEAEELPASLLVLGGGAIGLELAQVFARFGTRVTVIEASNRLLAVEEPEASEHARAVLEADGVNIKTGAKAESVTYSDGLFRLRVGENTYSAQELLVATGRAVNLADLGVDSVGLDPGAKALPVDERLRVGEKLWAVGDVTGKGAFTHVAMYQAGIVVRDVLGQSGPPADYRALPRVTFIDPEIGAVGLTERAARAAGVRVNIGKATISSSTRGWIHKVGNEGLIKLVVDADRGVLVGATSAGPAGGEVLAGLAVAVHGEVPVEKLRHMIYAYPTFHRAIGDALAALE